MPYRCCVPGCRGNYDEANKVSIFSFPKDLSLRDRWTKAIHRKDFSPSERSVVCERHFSEDLIIREDKMTRPDGSIITAPRKPTLTKNAVPHIFPCQFLDTANQRSFLEKLCIENEQNNYDLDEICNCKASLRTIVSLSISRMVNILLNNYTKKKNNDVSVHASNKKRKLATLVS